MRDKVQDKATDRIVVTDGNIRRGNKDKGMGTAGHKAIDRPVTHRNARRAHARKDKVEHIAHVTERHNRGNAR
jgi:hypothetical protein